MTTVASTNTTASASQAIDAALGGGKTLGKQEFLNLLVAQLQNQDPLNPVDDKEFVAQLAQFSSLEQAMQTNERLGLLQGTSTALNNAQVAGLIGQTIEANGNKVALADARPIPVTYDLGSDATETTITIRDANGKAVRTMSAGAATAGKHDAFWDGMDDSGNALPNGTYTIEVNAKNASGGQVTTSTRVRGTVTQVTFENGSAELIIGASGQHISPADVISVSKT
jgi:flagellar basal-body rod modification protein FlgD